MEIMLDLDRLFCYSLTMQGTVTKKHFFLILKAFGIRKAFRILFSRQPVALLELMK